jgi:hypothetical protein
MEPSKARAPAPQLGRRRSRLVPGQFLDGGDAQRGEADYPRFAAECSMGETMARGMEHRLLTVD